MCLHNTLMFTWKFPAMKKGMVLANRPKYRLWEWAWNMDCNLLYSNKVCIPKTWFLYICVLRYLLKLKYMVACQSLLVYSPGFLTEKSFEDIMYEGENGCAEMSRKERNAWFLCWTNGMFQTSTELVHFLSPGCRFKTTISLCLINSMYGDALVEKPY